MLTMEATRACSVKSMPIPSTMVTERASLKTIFYVNLMTRANSVLYIPSFFQSCLNLFDEKISLTSQNKNIFTFFTKCQVQLYKVLTTKQAYLFGLPRYHELNGRLISCV